MEYLLGILCIYQLSCSNPLTLPHVVNTVSRQVFVLLSAFLSFSSAGIAVSDELDQVDFCCALVFITLISGMARHHTHAGMGLLSAASSNERHVP